MHISTKANVHHAWAFSKHLRAFAAGGPFGVAWVVSWRLPAPLGRPGPPRHSKGTPRTRHKIQEVFGYHLTVDLLGTTTPPNYHLDLYGLGFIMLVVVSFVLTVPSLIDGKVRSQRYGIVHDAPVW